MKRVLALILTLVVGLGLLTACAPNQETCDHNWSEWTVVTEATCDENGLEKRTCSICDKEETREISAAHKWGEWEIKEPATCDHEGLKERECSVDHKKESEVIPAIGGDHSYKKTGTVEGDCVTKTQYVYTCSKCGESYKEEGSVVPAKHVGTTLGCGLHCEFCKKDLDHAATSCGVEGHFKCDGLDHTQCAIKATSNMKLTAIDEGKAWRLDGFTAAGDKTEVFVPAFVENKPVTEIGSAVFEGYLDDGDDGAIIEWLNTVTYVYIPDTVKTLGEYFAYDMAALETVRLPKEVASWASHTFFSVPSLKTLNLPRGTAALKGNVGDGSTEADYALESLTLPVTFTDLNSLRNFFYKSKVSAINYEGSEAAWTALVEKVTNTDYKAKLQEIAAVFEYDYNLLYAEESNDMQVRLAGFKYEDVEGGYAITGFAGTVGDTLIIPAQLLGKDVVALGSGLLDGSSLEGDAEGVNSNPLNNVKAIVFEGQIKSIGDYNFYNMDALEQVILPDSVTFVGSQCFYGCKNLTKAVIPDGATVDMSRSPFAYCPSLTSVKLPASLKNQSGAGAFVEGNAALAITFGGPRTMFDLATKAAKGNLATATITCNGGAQTVQDGNGSEYLLSEDGTYYTLVGFYDVVKNDGAAVTGYTIQDTYNELPIKAIGDAVFNSNAYADDEIAAWVKGLTGIVVTSTTGTNVEYIGNYNFVDLDATQYKLPVSIKNETLVGCFNNINPTTGGYGAFYTMRVPKGVKVMVDCFNWTEKTWFNGTVNPFLLLPTTLEKFEGKCWDYKGQPGAFFALFDCEDAQSRVIFQSLLDNSEVTTSTWKGASVPFMGTLITNLFIMGTGAFHLVNTFQVPDMTYDAVAANF